MTLLVSGCTGARSVGAALLLCALSTSSLSLADEEAIDLSEDLDTSASALSESRRILVGKLDGDLDNQARGWMIDGLIASGDYVFINDGKALQLTSDADQTEIATVAAENMADVVIVGSSKKKGKGYRATFRVYDGVDGRLLEKVEVSSPSQEKYETELLAGTDVAPVLAQAQGWPRTDAELGEEEAAEPPVEASAPRPSPLRVLAGVRLYSRSFRYTDGLWNRDPSAGYRAGQDYVIPAAAMPRAEVRWYPAAHFTGDWAAHLGVVLGYELGVGTSVSFSGVPLDQSHSLFFGGFRGRIPLGNVTVGLQSTFASHSLAIGGDEAASADGTPLFPDVSYSQIDLGVDAEWRNGTVILGGHTSLNLVLDTGGVGSAVGPTPNPWYPGTSAIGGEFGVYAGWELSRVFDLLLGADYRTYAMDFGPVDASTDPYQVPVAGGAADRYFSFWAGVAIHWPSPDEEAPSSASAESGDAGEGAADSEGGGDFDDFSDF